MFANVIMFNVNKEVTKFENYVQIDDINVRKYLHKLKKKIEKAADFQ